MSRQVRAAGVVTLRHIQTIRKGGRTYLYLRLPGAERVRLPDLPLDDPEFLAAYAQAIASAPKPTRAKSGSIALMIEGFLGSRDHLSRSESYRRTIRRHADAIKAQAEDALARDLREQDVEADLSPLCPNAAADRLKAWRLICKWGKINGFLTRDPSLAVKRKPIPKTIGHPAWSDAEIDRFRAHWPVGSVQRLCFEMVFWTGARISDAVKIGPGMVGRDGVLQFTQKKTGEPAFVPWTCLLPAYAVRMEVDRKMLFAALEARAERHMTFLATAYGTTRSEKALGHVISNAASKLGIEKSAHGLRKSRAKLLAEAGATVHQIAAWTGHIALEEVEHYTREASRRAAVRGEQKKKHVNP
ncbi:tyrosine-type recombinase/integrase [Rhodovulum kholense]|uniref:Site-specific recombinase XerD n=1 Tax=Rhodovulum kholense TaxID=453584 RepID=A0A8E3APZ7_9RHOB|nr:tyrosine-type recombinase/integrase [Rhodovulum kholense]PTW46064.1 site-specific recombinase XerD [Rhodovulum kholense]